MKNPNLGLGKLHPLLLRRCLLLAAYGSLNGSLKAYSNLTRFIRISLWDPLTCCCTRGVEDLGEPMYWLFW